MKFRHAVLIDVEGIDLLLYNDDLLKLYHEIIKKVRRIDKYKIGRITSLIRAFLQKFCDQTVLVATQRVLVLLR